MPDSPNDFATARSCMIEGQIRPERVRHPTLIAAMGTLPRETFVPAELQPIAYIDKEIRVGDDHTLTEPRVLARLLQAGEPRRGERALVVEAGTGYAAAVLARMGLAVTAVEAHDEVRAFGADACAQAGERVDWRADLGTLPAFALVVIDGGVEFVPDAVVRAVAPLTGRLLTILVEPGRPGRAVIGERIGDEIRLRPLFDAQASLLPDYVRPRGFVF